LPQSEGQQHLCDQNVRGLYIMTVFCMMDKQLNTTCMNAAAPQTRHCNNDWTTDTASVTAIQQQLFPA
jgi:hypothetical protein